MKAQSYPIFVRYPDALPPATSDAGLVEELKQLARFEHEFVRAQAVISQIDVTALALAYQTIQAAELLKMIYGWSAELEEFDRIRRQQYLQTMNELILLAHAQVVGHMKRR